MLLNEVKSSPRVHLTEFKLDEFDSAIANEEGEQVNNEVFFTYGMTLENKPKLDFTKELNHTVVDQFPPGTEWVYYKVYMGVKIADNFLLEISETIRQLKEEGKIEKWFFIRYHDPVEHLRIRFKLQDLQFIGEVMLRFNQFVNGFKKKFLIENIVLDTYQRELSRYGYEEIGAFEKIFQYDSEMNIQLIEFFKFNNCMDLIWLAAMSSTDSYCDMFQLDPETKGDFLEAQTERFRNEFNASPKTTKSLNTAYNKNKAWVNQVFLADNTDGIAQFLAIIEQRNEQCRPIIHGIVERNPSLSTAFLASVIHMNINRLFRSRQRLQEMVMYDFLRRINKTRKFVKRSVKHMKSV